MNMHHTPLPMIFARRNQARGSGEQALDLYLAGAREERGLRLGKQILARPWLPDPWFQEYLLRNLRGRWGNISLDNEKGKKRSKMG